MFYYEEKKSESHKKTVEHYAQILIINKTALIPFGYIVDVLMKVEALTGAAPCGSRLVDGVGKYFYIPYNPKR